MKTLKPVMKYLLLTCILYFVLPIILNTGFSFFEGIPVLWRYVWSIVLVNIFVLCTVMMVKQKKNIHFNERSLKVERKTIYYAGNIIILALGFCMFTHFVYVIPAFQPGLEQLPTGFTDEMSNLLNHSIGWFALTCIFIPICEEAFFKGILLNVFMKQLGVTKGILLGAFIFGALHLQSVIFVFLAYLIVGYIYYKQKNIYYAILFHISNNLFAVLFGYLLKNRQNEDIVKVGIAGAIIIVFDMLLMCKNKYGIMKDEM